MSATLYDTYYYAGTDSYSGVARTFTMNGAARGAMVGGPRVAREGEVVPRLQATLHHRPNIETTVAVLDHSYGRQWQEELNEVGSAAMTIGNEEAQATMVGPGDIVRFEDEGFAVFAWIVREIERTQIAEGEEHDQVTDFNGTGLLSMLSEAVVYPPRGPDVKPFDDKRLFSWPSVDYDDSWWRTATDLGAPNAGYWNDGITDWPTPEARWIWAGVPNALEWAPDGACYVRATFNVPPGVSMIRMYVILDAEGEIYVDGQSMGYALYDAEPVSPTIIDMIDATPGDHNVAIVCTNDVDPEADQIHNPGGVLFSCYGINSVGEYTPAYPLLVTNDTWRIVEYPPYAPGMTPGEVIRHVVQEAQYRGCMAGLTLAFSDEVDSDGNPWPQYTNIGTDVGTDLLTFFKELCATYIDMWMEPARFRLHVWIKGKKGEVVTDVALYPPTDTSDPWSGNLAALSYTRVD